MATARAVRLIASRPPSTNLRSLVVVPGRRRLLSTSTEAGGAGDPSVHSGGPPSDDYPDRPPKFSGADEATGGGHGKNPSTAAATPSECTKERVPPFAPSGKLGSQELADPAGGSSFTQKRRRSSSSSRPADSREEATPGGDEAAGRKVREEDREYYRTHKPSPLAEVEFADTRKPITRATDGGGGFSGVDPGKVVEDTADDSLARAEAMFREAASRGNPEWPHSRALAEMLARRRGEGDAAGSRNSAPWGS